MTREAPILFILYHEQWLWTWYVRNEHTSSSNRIESFYWNPLLRPDCIRTQEKKKSWWRGILGPRQTASIEPEDLNPRIWKVFWTMHSYPFKHSIDTTRKSHVCLTLCWKVGELEHDSHMAIISWSERWGMWDPSVVSGHGHRTYMEPTWPHTKNKVSAGRNWLHRPGHLQI